MAYTIVILLPGTTGSTLVQQGQSYDDTNPIWPTQVEAKVKSDEPAALSMLEGTLYAGVPVDWNDPTKGYGNFINYFKNSPAPQSFQYVNAQTPQVTPPPTGHTQYNWGLPESLGQNLLIGFAYDWRQDNTSSAQNLQNLLYNVNALYGDTYQLYLVGHSMGGLVSRTYLETGMANGDPGFAQIQGLITLGTPHLGAPLALEAIRGTLPVWFQPFISQPFETLVHNFVDQSFSDSTYELLPPPTPPSPDSSKTNFIQVDLSKSYSLFDDSSLPEKLQTQLATKGLNQTDLGDAR